MDDTSIKSNILKRRSDLGLTQTEMARRLGISLTAYRKIESGKTRILNSQLAKIAETTDTPLETLVVGFTPVDPANYSLEEIRETYEDRLRDLNSSYMREHESLREEIRRLEERLRDKDEIIENNRKLISHLEKELSRIKKD